MRHYILIILTALCTVEGQKDELTAIAQKQIFLDERRHIDLETHDFKEFVRRSNVFMDKSLLLKELLNDTSDRISILNYPQNWGKTLNMQMIKTFLEIEVDKKGARLEPHPYTLNYRFFQNGEIVLEDRTMQKLKKPLLISEYGDIMDDYLGRWPVIFLNFTHLTPGVSFDDVYGEIVNRISDSFAEHQYMKEAFHEIIDDKKKPEEERKRAEANLQTFEKLLWKKGNTTDVQSSLNFLTDVLEDHFGQKVFILVDSYDAPFHNTFLCGTFPKSHEQIFFDFYRKFNFHTFVVNPNMEKAILTGVLPLAKGDLMLSLKDGREYTLLRYTEAHKFHGFTRPEVDDLFELYGMDQNLTKLAHKFYDGYHARLYDNKTRIYESSSVAYFLNTKTIKRYSNPFCSKFYAVDSIRQTLNGLLSGIQLPVVDLKNLTFYKEDFKRLQDGLYYNEYTEGPILRSFLKYAYASGFVTASEIEYQNNLCIRFANGEVYSTWGEGLAVYYARQFGFKDMKVGKEQCRRFNNDFMDFIASDNKTSDVLRSTLESYFSLVFRPHGFMANENENMTHLVLDFVALFLKSFRRYPTYDGQIVLFNKEVGVIIDSSFNKSSADEALQRAKPTVHKIVPLRIARVKFIGINVKPNSTVDLIGESLITKLPGMDYRDI